MKFNRIGLVGVAAAAALVGCDSGSGELVGNDPIQITPENAPAVAAQGGSMVEGNLSPGDATNSALPVSVSLNGKPNAGMSQVMTLGKLAAIIRAQLDAAGAGGSISLPVGVAIIEPVVTDCPAGGNYTTTGSYPNYDIVYNACTYSYAEPSYSSNAVYNGHITSTFVAGYGGYGGTSTYTYDNFTSKYQSVYNGQISHGNWSIDGEYTWENAYGGYGGSTVYTYGATGLTIGYDYNWTDEMTGEPSASRGNIVYDTYHFTYTWDGSVWSWDGSMSARDSNYGQWAIYTASPWSVNYCGQTVDGEIVYAGGFEEEMHGGASGNTLHSVADGSDMVTLDLYNASGTKISSQVVDWFPWDGNCPE